jgi:hypothetical protein
MTPDQVVATNIKKLRTGLQRDWSRARLAGELTNSTGTEWSRWRIIDLEGARTADQEPRPATWTEIIALAIVFGVTVFDLVLPTGNEEVVIRKYQEPMNGNHEGRNVGFFNEVDPESFASTLFRLPVKYLNIDCLNKASGSDLGQILSLVDLQRDRSEAADVVKRSEDRIRKIADHLSDDAIAALRELVKNDPESYVTFLLDDPGENEPLFTIYTDIGEDDGIDS